MDALLASLLDLLYELRDQNVPLMVGGGFGLFLKRKHLIERGERTLFHELPELRSTNDIDIFLRVDLLADRSRMGSLVRAIQRVGYVPVEEAKYFQWKRPIMVQGVRHEIRLDALVGPLGEHLNKLNVNPPRVRPKGASVGFHAFQTDEALYLEDNPVAVTLQGTRTGGEEYRATVYVPEAFPYLLMKLSAFADRLNDPNKDLGRHHALDAYTIVGIMTEWEYIRAKDLAGRSRNDPHFARVCQVVATEFATTTSLGILRLREHRLSHANLRIGDFIDLLKEVFSLNSH